MASMRRKNNPFTWLMFGDGFRRACGKCQPKDHFGRRHQASSRHDQWQHSSSLSGSVFPRSSLSVISFISPCYLPNEHMISGGTYSQHLVASTQRGPFGVRVVAWNRNDRNIKLLSEPVGSVKPNVNIGDRANIATVGVHHEISLLCPAQAFPMPAFR